MAGATFSSGTGQSCVWSTVGQAVPFMDTQPTRSTKKQPWLAILFVTCSAMSIPVGSTSGARCVDRLCRMYLKIPQERLEGFAAAHAEIGRKAAAELGRQARLLKLARRLPVLATGVERHLKRLV